MVASLLLALALGSAGPAYAPPEVSVTAGGLTTAQGASLYTYANDTMAGMSHCSGACAADYPPLIAPQGAKPAGDWSVIDRGDGAHQWAYRDKPLYTSRKSAAEIARSAAEGGYWSPATLGGDTVAANTSPQVEGSEFSCGGDRKIVAQFTGQALGPGVIVDAGDGPHSLALMPWRGGEPSVTWSDGSRTLVWSTGVKLMWMDGASHLACGRAAHHH